jgi:beta-glucosidase
VKGLQGNHSRYVRANAGCKHFDAHGGPEDIPSDRMKFNSVVRTDLFIVAEDVCNVKT